jgi:hypothetical protein
MSLLASDTGIALVSKLLGLSFVSVTSDVHTTLSRHPVRRSAEGASGRVPPALARRMHNKGAPAKTRETRNPATYA